MSSKPLPEAGSTSGEANSGIVKGQEVSLGCGTLILIALIVIIFGRSDTDELENEVRALRTSVEQLTTAVESQATELRALRERGEPMMPAPE